LAKIWKKGGKKGGKKVYSGASLETGLKLVLLKFFSIKNN